MAIAFDNAAGTATSGAINTIGLLLTATTNAVLLVYTNCDGNASISAVNIGATQLTRLGGIFYLNGVSRAELWGLTAPPSGVLTISAVQAGGVATGFGILGITYTGHNTGAGGPFGEVDLGTATGVASTSITVSSTAGNVVVCAFPNHMFNPSSCTVGASLTKRFFLSAYPSIVLGDVAGASSITGSGSATSAISWASIGLNLIASTAAATAWQYSLGMLGVGR